MIILGIPVGDNPESDELTKAFSAGPRASHKYWRRVRIFSQGKLGWRYYYNTPEDRQRYLDDRKKKKRQKRQALPAEVREVLDAEEDSAVLHVDKAGWADHFPEFALERVPIRDLTVDSIFKEAGLTAPAFSMDGPATAFANEMAEQDEPDDLWGKQIHPLRLIEAAVKMMPQEIRTVFPDALKNVQMFGEHRAAVSEESNKKGLRKAAAWAFSREGRIVIPLDTCHVSVPVRKPEDTSIKGGNYPIAVFIHEWAHCIERQMKSRSDASLNRLGMPNWKDWVSDKKVQGEATITDYAKTNEAERFCESFAAAILDPVSLAEQCPATYAFMRRMMPSALPPRDELLAMDFPADSVSAFVNPWSKKSPKPLTIAQEIVANIPEPTRAPDIYKVEPADPDKTGKQGNADRFYETNHRGRTIFFRYGMEKEEDQTDGKSNADWEPPTATLQPGQKTPKVTQLKEVYDERGNPIDPAYAYLHLIQDEIKDDTVIGVVGKTKVTMEYIRANGGLSSDDPAIKKLFDKSVGSRTTRMFLRGISKGIIHNKMAELADLNSRLSGATGAARTKIEAEIAKLEKESAELDSLKAKRAEGLNFMPTPLTIVPHEVTANHFRQKSGCFNFDNWRVEGSELIDRLQSTKAGSAEELAILEEFADKYPGTLSVKNRRYPKGAKITDPKTGKQISVGGRLRKGSPYVEIDPTTGRRVPATIKRTFVLDNPDGSKTKVETFRGSDGRYRIRNQMWAKLLTPNGEEVNSAEHLEQLAKVAARNRHRTWLSVKTDRRRIRTASGAIKVEKSGEVDRHLHVEVEFDGSGPPRLLGNRWKKKLGTDVPRIDMLLEKDPLGEKVSWAKDRNIIPAAQINLSKAEERTGPPNQIGDRVVLTTETLDWKGSTDRGGREVVARLIKYIPGSEIGEIPNPPGWERMPEGVPNLEREDPAGLPGKLSPKMKRFISDGLLPEWYTHTPKQREWYNAHFLPAYAEWDKTKDAKIQEKLDPVYVFSGETGMGGGSNTFRRVGDEAAMASTKFVSEAPAPEPLAGDPLVYLHKYIDPRTGATLSTEPRILLPTDGSIPPEQLANVPGVRLHKVKIKKEDGTVVEEVDRITLTLEAFSEARKKLTTLSLTGDITTLLEQRVEMLKAAEKQREQEAHQLSMAQIDPAYVNDNWDAGLNKTLPNGAEFTLADHQQRGLQKLFDNDLRCLLAHFMGTGKTVSAIAACKMAMARPMRQGLQPGEKVPDDLVGDAREQWLADHPFMPGTLDPRNPKRCLIVAPLNTVEQWRQAGSDFDDGALVVGAGDNDIPIDEFVAQIKSGAISPDMVVVGPQYFTQHAAKLKACGFDGLVIDEVHQGIKNESAERNKVVKDWNSDMKMMLLLTGTPMTTSPADIVEYVRILSNGKQWAGMTKAAFTEEYLEKTPLPVEMGVQGIGAPKLRVKPEKRAELAAIIAQWMDIALQKHVKGKVLPAVRIADQHTSEMSGAQLDAYNFYMGEIAALGASGGLSDEEVAKLGADAKKQSLAAKGVMNCVGYSPSSEDPYVVVQEESLDSKGKIKLTKKVFTTPNPEYLFSKKMRGANAGKWQSVEELGEQAASILTAMSLDVLGLPYAELAGKPIGYGYPVPGLGDPLRTPPTKAQVKAAKKAMVDAGWVGGAKIENPDAGEVGIRFRGSSIGWREATENRIAAAENKGDNSLADSLRAQRDARGDKLNEARDFQRAYRHALRYGVGEIEDTKNASPDTILAELAREYEISFEDAQSLLHIMPNPSETESTLTTKATGGYGKVTVTKDDTFVSDRKGSLHLLYSPDDWDYKAKQPKSNNTPVSELAPNARVRLSPSVLNKHIPKPKVPTGLPKEERDRIKAELEDWAPPPIRLVSAQDRAENGDVAVRRTDTNEVFYVPEKSVSGIVASLMDPGQRENRLKADISMTHGNAKAEDVRRYIEQFHDGSGAGPDGERQMVLFANSILTGCRTLEAVARLMGYRDVNEVCEGSPLHDPTDSTTKGGTSPNGKTFVTYIGSTYTGDREQNVLIFKKVKDALGRDSKTSLFTHMNLEPRPPQSVKVNGESVPVDWMTYRGDVGNDHLPPGVDAIQMSQFSPEQRKTAQATLGIKPPESYVRVGQEKRYFYGADVPAAMKRSLLEAHSTKDKDGKWEDSFATSAALLKAINRTPDPSKIKDPALADKMRARIAALKEAYSRLASDNSTMDPPLDGKQISAFDNCEMIICSDAAQVGMNLGNAAEMGMYDSLGSPAAEWQRMTRCARLLPEAVKKKLLGKPIMEQVKVPKRDKSGAVVMKNGNPVMVAKREVDPETGKMAPVLVQKRNETGQFLYETTGEGRGIVDMIRDQEPALFAVEDRSMTQASVGNVTLGGFVDDLGAKRSTPEVEKKLKAMGPATDALDMIAQQADLVADNTRNSKSRKAWEAIAAQARTARNQGGMAARAQLLRFKDAVSPTTGEQLLNFPLTSLPEYNPMEGTYAKVDTKSAEKAIRKAFNSMDDSQRQAILDAGFEKSEPPNVGSPDFAGLYLAIRAQEVLTWVDTMRPVVTDQMKAQVGGATVTDEEVMNRLIDMMSPTDRSILKDKKYLVNVRKFKASGAIGQTVRHKYVDDEGNRENAKVAAGFENEYPVKPEVRTSVLGRARTVSNEQILTDVQNGVEYKADVDFDFVSSKDFGTASMLKATRLVFDLNCRPFNPLDLIKSTNNG